MVRVSGKIRRILVDAGLVTEEEWANANVNGGQPLATLLSKGEISEGKLLGTLGRASGVPPVDRAHVRPDPEAVEPRTATP